MATTVKSADLDFNTIKARLKDYFQQQNEFNSYDFEASGLSNVLDVLAYNTHLNALTANMALNESFLPSSQLRSSVLSHAAMLGYETRSRTASQAVVNLSLNLSGVVGRPVTINLPAGTSFSANVDGTSFTFSTRTAFKATDNGSGTYNFLTTDGSADIPIHEGVEKTKTFLVGPKEERQIYVIPDETLDKYSLDVKVFRDISSTLYDEYLPLRLATSITSTSKHYQIQEVPNGYYELNFGDGISFGQSPAAGEKIVATYRSTKGPIANGASAFLANSTVTVNSVAYVLQVTTVSESSGGGDKQSIDSIKQLAPIAYASQNRLVTSLDYKASIETNFGQHVEQAAIWSGDENVPIDYGAVYISLDFKNNTPTATQQTVKDAIRNTYVNNLATMSMTPKFVDPKNVFLELTTNIRFDPSKTGIALPTMEGNVSSLISTFFADNLDTFGKVFRRSNLLTEIDAFDVSILSSRIDDIKVQMREPIDTNNNNTFEIQYPCEIEEPDDEYYRVTTNAFVYAGQTCRIKNRLKSNQLAIMDLDDKIVLDNVGSYDRLKGQVNIIGFRPTSMLYGSTNLKISVVPRNGATIYPLRNYILNLEKDESTVTAVIDRQAGTLSVQN